jgi:hypothetical protein
MPSAVTARLRSVYRSRSPWVAFPLLLVALVSLDSLLFHTSLYSSILATGSSSGQFELILRRERMAQQRLGDNIVVTLGDSRMACTPRICNALTPQTGYVFRTAGVAGSDVRSWYYMLRDLDPTAQRYQAIVFGVNDYYDEDEYFRPDDDIRALHYCIGLLRFSDVPGFAFSFHSRPVQFEAFRGALLKGLVYQADIQDFLSHPKARLAEVRQVRAGFEESTYNFVYSDRSTAGLQIDWATRTATFPPGMDTNQRETVKAFLLRDVAPQDGREAAFRRTWYGKILECYRNSRTRIVFVKLPRGPIPRPDNLSPKLTSSIREFAARPNVILYGEHAFDSLEHPELFQDGLHLNREGVDRFSKTLASGLAALLGPPRPARRER